MGFAVSFFSRSFCMSFPSLETLDDYLNAYGALLGRKAISALQPLHEPGRHEPVDGSQFYREPFEPQLHVITAAVKALRRQKSIVIVGQMGVGKTLLGPKQARFEGRAA
jgi:hypothetical protein